MSLPAFLYRRLTRLVPFELSLGSGRIRLGSKYEIASFQDVFCSPFYWQLLSYLERPPALVVDCGAHCGHFALLADACISMRFGESHARYVAIEPNPVLARVLRRNLRDSPLRNRSSVLEAAVGVTAPVAILWVERRNYLTARVARIPGARPMPVATVDLGTALGPETLDVLKLDIEGAEYDFVERSAPLLERTRLVMMELHPGAPGRRSELMKRLDAAKHTQLGPAFAWSGGELIAFRNRALT